MSANIQVDIAKLHEIMVMFCVYIIRILIFLAPFHHNVFMCVDMFAGVPVGFTCGGKA